MIVEGMTQPGPSSSGAWQSSGAGSPPLTPAVEARGLTKTFGTNRAVDGIDLTVKEGEIFGVLGPNGAGKTTTLNMLATLLPIDSGEARIFGHDVRSEGHAVRQLIGVTGQYASVDENLTAPREPLAVRSPAGAVLEEGPQHRRRPAREVRPDRGGSTDPSRSSPAACAAASISRPA